MRIMPVLARALGGAALLMVLAAGAAGVFGVPVGRLLPASASCTQSQQTIILTPTSAKQGGGFPADAGTQVTLTATNIVDPFCNPISGGNVSFSVTKPDGQHCGQNGVAASSGTATWKLPASCTTEGGYPDSYSADAHYQLEKPGTAAFTVEPAALAGTPALNPGATSITEDQPLALTVSPIQDQFGNNITGATVSFTVTDAATNKQDASTVSTPVETAGTATATWTPSCPALGTVSIASSITYKGSTKSPGATVGLTPGAATTFAVTGDNSTTDAVTAGSPVAAAAQGDDKCGNATTNAPASAAFTLVDPTGKTIDSATGAVDNTGLAKWSIPGTDVQEADTSFGGTTTYAIAATGSGGAVTSTNAALTVLAADPAGTFTIAVNPSSVQVATAPNQSPGSSGTTITTLSTGIIKDKYLNVVQDTTPVVFTIAKPDGSGAVSYDATTTSGVATYNCGGCGPYSGPTGMWTVTGQALPTNSGQSPVAAHNNGQAIDPCTAPPAGPCPNGAPGQGTFLLASGAAAGTFTVQGFADQTSNTAITQIGAGQPLCLRAAAISDQAGNLVTQGTVSFAIQASAVTQKVGIDPVHPGLAATCFNGSNFTVAGSYVLPVSIDGASAQFSLTVNPQTVYQSPPLCLSANPPSVPAGSAVDLGVSFCNGFVAQAASPVTAEVIGADGSDWTGTAYIGANGQASFHYTNTVTSGEYDVILSGTDSHGNLQQAPASFQVTPLSAVSMLVSAVNAATSDSTCVPVGTGSIQVTVELLDKFANVTPLSGPVTLGITYTPPAGSTTGQALPAPQAVTPGPGGVAITTLTVPYNVLPGSYLVDATTTYGTTQFTTIGNAAQGLPGAYSVCVTAPAPPAVPTPSPAPAPSPTPLPSVPPSPVPSVTPPSVSPPPPPSASPPAVPSPSPTAVPMPSATTSSKPNN